MNQQIALLVAVNVVLIIALVADSQRGIRRMRRGSSWVLGKGHRSNKNRSVR